TKSRAPARRTLLNRLPTGTSYDNKSDTRRKTAQASAFSASLCRHPKPPSILSVKSQIQRRGCKLCEYILHNVFRIGRQYPRSDKRDRTASICIACKLDPTIGHKRTLPHSVGGKGSVWVSTSGRENLLTLSHPVDQTSSLNHVYLTGGEIMF